MEKNLNKVLYCEPCLVNISQMLTDNKYVISVNRLLAKFHASASLSLMIFNQSLNPSIHQRKGCLQ